jgi:uncharacterized membrane protein YoaK (UPF0700 family)
MMTNITQLTLDLATIMRGHGEPEELAHARRRASVTFPCVVGFVGGCAAGAALEVKFGLWALVPPVVLTALAVPLVAWSGAAPFPARSPIPLRRRFETNSF